MVISDRIYPFFDAARRVHNYHTKTPLLTALMFVFLLSLLAYYLIKKRCMAKKLGLANMSEYKEYKQSCLLNFKNKFCISEDWVINEYSLKVYPSADLVDIARVSGGATSASTGKSPGRFVAIGLRGGTDRFCTYSSYGDVEYLIRNVEEYIRCRRKGETFAQELPATK